MSISPNRMAAVAFAAGIIAASAGSFVLQSGSAFADQPVMQRALASLQTARQQLQNADANKGGHRVRAIGFVDQAIAETIAGIEFARGN